MPIPKSWVMRLPQGLREQAAWIFIGFMVFMVGLSYAFGIVTTSIQEAIGPEGVRVWGGFLAFSGAFTIWATYRQNPAHEKFALRLMAFAMLAYVLWLLTEISFRQAAMHVILASILIGIAEIRIGFLKVVLDYVPREDPHAGNHG